MYITEINDLQWINARLARKHIYYDTKLID